MTPEQLPEKWRQARQRLLSELPRQATIAATDLSALVKNRVIQRGESAAGAPFTPYSTVAIPAFFYKGKSRTGSAEGKITALAKQREKISYRDFREINNLKTDKKNFEFTGEMWRGVEVQTSGGGAVVTATIQGGNQASRERLSYGSAGENTNLLRPNEKEIEVIRANLQKWLSGIINEALQ